MIGVAALVALRLSREFLADWYGWKGLILGLVVFLVLVFGWRAILYRRARRNGGSEYTPAMIAKQFDRSGVAPPAFEEDGTLLGSSVFAVNQKSKMIEVVGEYEIFANSGARLGWVRQIGQSRWKQVLRFVTAFDQFFTHHFDITDSSDALVLRVTRPRKWFKSRVEVFGPDDVFVGRIVQQNVFGKIDFGIFSPSGELLGRLRAENWRAWDFRIELPSGIEVARITKTWEGTARTVLSTADTYVVRVHQRLSEPLRSLVFVAGLTVDLALKQDSRGLGG